MTDKSLSLLDKIVNHTGKTARQLELLEEYFKKQSVSTTTANATNALNGNTTKSVKGAERASQKQLSNMPDSVKGLANALAQFAIIPNLSKNNFINFLERYVAVVNTKVNTKGSEFLVNSLGMIGNSLSHIGLGIDSFKKIKKKDEDKIFSFINRLVDVLYNNSKKINALDKNKSFEKLLNITKSFSDLTKNVKLESIEKGSKILKKMAFSILGFATGIVLGGAVLVASTLILAPVVVILIGLTKVFTNIGKNSKNIEAGAKSLKSVGVSMLFISGGLALLGLVTIINPVGILGGIGLIALTGLTYYVIGKGWGSILKGVVAVGFMSLSMMLFAAGIYTWSKLNISLTDTVLPMIGALLGMSAAWSIAGLAIELIIPGSIAVGLIGASAWVLGKGMNEISKLKIDASSVESFGNLSWELIKVYSAAGLASVLIIPGSLAMLAIGTSLNSISTGLKALETVNINNFNPDKLARLITGISGAFAAAGSEEGTKFNLFTFVSGIELGPNAVKRGIQSTLQAGEALSSITKGVLEFSKISDKLNFDINSPNSITRKIVDVTTAISYVFAEIGKSGNESSSLWKVVFGTDFKKSDTELGIRSVKDVGNTLTSVAKGIAEFSNLSKMGIKENDFDSSVKGSIANNISYVIGMIHNIFAQIGKDGNDSSSLWKGVFGTDFKKSDTELGIRSVKGVGSELESIARSLVQWKDLNKIGVNANDFIPKYDSNGRIIPGNLISNIAFVIGSISDIFARVGKKDDTFFPWNDGDVKNGVDAVKGVGKELESYANSLKIFGSIDKKTYDMLYTVVPRLISLVPMTFASVYDKIKGKEDGVQMVSKLISTSLSDISSSVDGLTKNFEDKKFNSGYIGRIGGDLRLLFDQVTDKVNPQRLMNLRTFGYIISDLSKIVDPFIKFQKAFNLFSIDMKNFANDFSKINIENFEKFSNGVISSNETNSVSIPYSAPNNTSSPTDIMNTVIPGFTESIKSALNNNNPKDNSITTKNDNETLQNNYYSAQNNIDINALADLIANKLMAGTLMVSPSDINQWNKAFRNS